MENCDNCLCWLKNCNAECCKQFSITTINGYYNLKKGDIIQIAHNISEDLVWYYRLHNIPATIEGFRIKLDRFKVEGNRLFIFKKCSLLNKENKCMGYPDNRPQICKDGPHIEGTYTTPNCLWRKK